MASDARARADRESANAVEWERRAMLAVQGCDDDLARDALRRKREHAVIAEGLDREARTVEAMLAEMRRGLDELRAPTSAAEPGVAKD